MDWIMERNHIKFVEGGDSGNIKYEIRRYD